MFKKLNSYKRLSLYLSFIAIAGAIGYSGYYYKQAVSTPVTIEFANKLNERTIIKTKRLIMKQVSDNDRNNLQLIFQNPEITSTLSHTDSYSDKELDEIMSLWIRNIKAKVPFSAYLAYKKDNNEFVGYAALEYIPGTRPDRANLSYAVIKKFWKQGYGYEMASALMKDMLPKAIRHGYRLSSNSELKTITGTANENNLASRKILEKLGFIYLHSHNMARYFYTVKP